MKIWIDADAAPLEIKQIVFRAAKRVCVETRLVANQPLPLPANAPMIQSIQVPLGANAADRYMIEHAEAGDIAITADLPLAAELVARNVSVIDPRGTEYSPDTIASRLSMRNFMDDLRGSGMITGGSPPFNELDKKAFASTFDRLLTKAIRSSLRTP